MTQEIIKASRSVLAKCPNPTFPQAIVVSACLLAVAEATQALASVLVAGIGNGLVPDFDFKNLRFRFIKQATPVVA